MENGHPCRLESHVEDLVSALAHYAVVACVVGFNRMSELVLW